MNGLPCIALIFDHGLDEWALLALIVFVLFGPKRIPDIARTIGRTLAQLRRAADAFKDELAELGDSAATPPPPAHTLPRPAQHEPPFEPHQEAAPLSSALPAPGHEPAGAAPAAAPAPKTPGLP